MPLMVPTKPIENCWPRSMPRRRPPATQCTRFCWHAARGGTNLRRDVILLPQRAVHRSHADADVSKTRACTHRNSGTGGAVAGPIIRAQPTDVHGLKLPFTGLHLGPVAARLALEQIFGCEPVFVASPGANQSVPWPSNSRPSPSAAFPKFISSADEPGGS